MSRRLCANGSTFISCANYRADLQRFMTLHPELNAYDMWFREARRKEFCQPNCGMIGQQLANTYTTDDWRDPKYLDRYIREQHARR